MGSSCPVRNRRNDNQWDGATDSTDIMWETFDGREREINPSHLQRRREIENSGLDFFAQGKATALFSLVFILIAVALGYIQLRIENQVNILRGELKSCSFQADNLTTQINTLYTQIDSQNVQIESLNSKISNQIAEISSLNRQIHSQNVQLQISIGFTSSKLWKAYREFQEHIFQPQIGKHTVIGIDLGSKFTHSAVYFSGKIHKIPHFDHLNKTFNSMATYVGLESFESLVGQSAQQAVKSSTKFIPIVYDVVSLLRHEIYADINNNSSSSYINLGFNLGNKGENRTVAVANSLEYPVVEILSKIFQKVRNNAEKFLNFSKITKCVIGHGFVKSTSNIQRKIIFESAKMGGFEEIQLLDAATVATSALVPPLSSLTTPKVVLFMDFGARYWRFSVLEVSQGASKILEGGITYDSGYLQNDLAHYCLEKFNFGVNSKLLKVNTAENIIRFRRLHEASDRAMISLSTMQTALIHIPDFFEGNNLTINIFREKFEAIVGNKLDTITENSKKVMNSAGHSKDSINEVMLVGGCSRIPKVREIVTGLFGNKVITQNGIEPDETVAFGSAVHGAILAADQS